MVLHKKFALAYLLGVLSLILVAAVLWMNFLSDADDQYALYLTEATKQVSDEDYSEAYDLYVEMLDLDPTRTEAYEGIVEVLILKRRYVEASEIIAEAPVTVDPEVLANLAATTADGLYEEGLYDEAYEHAKYGYGLKETESMTSEYFKVALFLGEFDVAESLAGEDGVDPDSDDYRAYELLEKEDRTLYETAQDMYLALGYGQPSVALEIADQLDYEGEYEYWEFDYYKAIAHYMLSDYSRSLSVLEASRYAAASHPEIDLLVARNSVYTGAEDDAVAAYNRYFSASGEVTQGECIEILRYYRDLGVDSTELSSGILDRCDEQLAGVASIYNVFFRGQELDLESVKALDLDGVDQAVIELYLELVVARLVEDDSAPLNEVFSEQLQDLEFDGKAAYIYLVEALDTGEGEGYKMAISADVHGYISKYFGENDQI